MVMSPTGVAGRAGAGGAHGAPAPPFKRSCARTHARTWQHCPRLPPTPPRPHSHTALGSRRLGPLRLPALRPGALFAPRWYAWLVASNLVLRLAWAHRLLGKLEAHAAVALAVALLEAFRRYQWAYVRVESELRKLRLKHEHDDDGPAGVAPLGAVGAPPGDGAGSSGIDGHHSI